MERPALKSYNAIATYPDAESARKAIEAVSMAGINGEDISLLGRSVEEASAEEDTSAIDVRTTQHIGKHTAAGAAVGGGSGALIGLLAGTAAIAIPGVGPAVGAGIWIAGGVLNGALIGGTIGGLIAGEAALTDSEAWDKTFESIREGRVLVGVHLDDEKNFAKAVEVLERHEPMNIARFDRYGNRQPALA